MTFYKYDKATKIYSGAVTADDCPESATPIVPYAKEDLILVFNELEDNWNYITLKQSMELRLAHDSTLQSNYKGVTDDCKFIPLTNADKLEKGLIKIEDEKSRIKILIINSFEDSFFEIKDKYPQAEREGWTVLVDEAKNWLVDNKLQNIPCLHAETGNTQDISVITNLANKIIANSLQYKKFYGQQKHILSQRLERLENATTGNELYNLESELRSN